MGKLDLRLQNILAPKWKGIAVMDELKGRWTAGVHLHL